NQTDEQLLNSFVVNLKPFQRILRELKASKLGTSSQHFLIEAQRGMGKTTLLLRLRIEIEQNPKLAHLLPVQFAEEQYGIYSLCQLWEHVAEVLEESAGFETLLDELDYAAEQVNYAQDCFYLLEKYLKKNNKQLVLLLDNVGDILNRFSKSEKSRLRDIFHASPYIQLIAASARALEATYQHDQPFYEFFCILYLKGLDKKDTHKLLKKLAENDNQQAKIKEILKTQSARVETIRRLTGGVPRTIVLLYEIFIDESAGVFEDLEVILDHVSPLYKHRMDDLSTQQQVIINTLALNWDGMTTKEITAKLNNTHFSSKKIAAQLRQLEKNALVESRLIDKKNKVYLLQERFFNIWYLMRYGRRKNKTQVLWLVRFLSEWCDKDELVIRAKRHIEAAKEGRLHAKGGVYMTEALASLLDDIFLQHELVVASRNALKSFIKNIDNKISKSDKELFDEIIKTGKSNKKSSNEFIQYILSLFLSDNIIEQKNGYKEIYRITSNYVNHHFYSHNEDYKQDIIQMSIINIDRYGRKSLNIENYSTFIRKIIMKTGIMEYHRNEKFEKLIYLHQEGLIDLTPESCFISSEHEEEVEFLSLIRAIIEWKLLEPKDLKILTGVILGESHTNIALEVRCSNSCVSERIHILRKKLNNLKEKNIFNIYSLAISQLLNNSYKESINAINKILALPDSYQSIMKAITDYFLLLLAKQQTESAYNLFQQFPNLKQQIKPVYYALMTLLKDQYPKEHLKMGSELEETVQEILQQIEEKAKRYGDHGDHGDHGDQA
ncbi:hypothetical protein, partial [Lutibacter sp.]